MSKLTRRCALTLAIGAAWTAARAADAPASWTAVDAAAHRLIVDQASPGASISVMKAGNLVYSKGFGLANLETATPATPTSIYKIGSITKQFTAAALMSLQEDGKLSVDDPLSRFFTDFQRGGEITLRQMLTHTSGLGNYTNTSPPEAFIQEARVD